MAIVITEEEAAIDALLEKREADAVALWEEINRRGLDAVLEMTHRLTTLEGQNIRLNRRIETLETQIRFLDRFERLIDLEISHSRVKEPTNS
jgi:hypothetical protein